MFNKFRVMLFCLVFYPLCGVALVPDYTDKSIRMFFRNLEVSMNTGRTGNINKFLRYYIADNATIQEDISAVDSNIEEELQKSSSKQYTKEEYISKISKVLNNSDKYAYSNRVDSIRQSEGSQIYIISLAVREEISNDPTYNFEASEYSYKHKYFSSAACNVVLDMIAPNDPSILGMKCVKKLAVR